MADAAEDIVAALAALDLKALGAGDNEMWCVLCIAVEHQREYRGGVVTANVWHPEPVHSEECLYARAVAYSGSSAATPR